MVVVLLACSISFLLLAFAIVGVIRVCFITVTVKGESMLPTLAEFDRVLVWRYWQTRCLKRGQIVLLQQSSQRVEGHSPFIKRIIGLPGDKIVTSIYDISDRARPSLLAEFDARGERIWYVPPRHLFVQGDNRSRSVDSQIWGPVPFEQVGGIVLKKLPSRDGDIKRKHVL